MSVNGLTNSRNSLGLHTHTHILKIPKRGGQIKNVLKTDIEWPLDDLFGIVSNTVHG